MAQNTKRRQSGFIQLSSLISTTVVSTVLAATGIISTTPATKNFTALPQLPVATASAQIQSPLAYLLATEKVIAEPKLVAPEATTAAALLLPLLDTLTPSEATSSSEAKANPPPETTPTPQPTLTPVTNFQASPSAESADTLNADVIFELINAHRAMIEKPAFVKDDRICSVAASRTPELYNEIFVTHTMHAGFFARNLPYWATENVAHFGSEEIIVNWWLHSPVHRAAIEGDYTYSCGACLGHSCSQIFTNFAEK